MADPKEWWAGVPPLTKILFGGSFGLTLAANMGLVSMQLLIFDPFMIWNKFEIWRLVTCVFFFGKLGFPFLINMYFLYSYSIRLEQGLYERRPADYTMMLLVAWVTSLCCAYFLDLMIIGPVMMIAILYTWCSVNAEQTVSFYFGTQFPAMYLPWALMLFNVLLGGNGMMELIGIFVGHVYFFLKYKYPRDFGGSSWLETPNFLRYYLPDEGPGRGGFGVAPASRRAAAPDRPRNWGAGYTLGGN